MNIIDEINFELDRLGVGTKADPYSGLMAGEYEGGGIRIFDDHADELYKPEVLEFLKGLRPEDVTLADEPGNVWEQIRPYENWR